MQDEPNSAANPSSRQGGAGAETPIALRGGSPAVGELRRLLRRAAALEMPTLVEGEPGVGKREMARFLHARSPRAAGPFIAVSCPALRDGDAHAALLGTPDGLVPAALERSRGGTLVLEEVTELPPRGQAVLVGFLRDGLLLRAAGPAVDVDVRIVSTSRLDVAREARRGRFRVDLHHRLAAVVARVPPLRERREDLPALAAACLTVSAGPGRQISRAALAALQRRAWPGNVRELRHVLEHASVRATDGVVRPEHLAGAQPA